MAAVDGIFELKVLTKAICQPIRLIVVFHGHGARVEEDHGDDGPEPPLLLAHLTNDDPRPSDTGRPFALGT